MLLTVLFSESSYPITQVELLNHVSGTILKVVFLFPVTMMQNEHTTFKF